jgi:hypothetical protein
MPLKFANGELMEASERKVPHGRESEMGVFGEGTSKCLTTPILGKTFGSQLLVDKIQIGLSVSPSRIKTCLAVVQVAFDRCLRFSFEHPYLRMRNGG